MTGSQRTASERREIARKARRYGYYRDGAELYVFCPLCRERVHGCWDTATRMLRTLNQELDRAMVDHLIDGCSVASVPVCSGATDPTPGDTP
jgi:hypothetical protein